MTKQFYLHQPKKKKIADMQWGKTKRLITDVVRNKKFVMWSFFAATVAPKVNVSRHKLVGMADQLRP